VQGSRADIRSQLGKVHREVGVLHLIGDDLIEWTLVIVGSKDSKSVAWNKGWNKERKALNMVPVSVGDEQGNILVSPAFSKDVLSGFSNACSGIDQDKIVPIADFNTGGVAAIPNGVRSRAGN
jgi:hypothetical protein